MINGLPAHVLLVHFVVVLAPVAGLLLILCGVWGSARRRVVWVAAGLAVVVAALTPLTIDAGEWLESRVGASPGVMAHTRLGDSMSYVAVGLVAAGILVVALHLRERVRPPSGVVLRVVVAAVTVVIGTATVVQVYRIGDSGARAAWADQISAPAPAAQP